MNVYLLESGLVRLFFTNPRGQEDTLEIVGAPATIGIHMLHEDQNRLMGAAAVQPCAVAPAKANRTNSLLFLDYLA